MTVIPCQYTPDPNLQLKYTEPDIQKIVNEESNASPTQLYHDIQALLAESTDLTAAQKTLIQNFVDSLEPTFNVNKVPNPPPGWGNMPNTPLVDANGNPVSYAEFCANVASGSSTLMNLNYDGETIQLTCSQFQNLYAGCTMSDGGAAYNALMALFS